MEKMKAGDITGMDTHSFPWRRGRGEAGRESRNLRKPLRSQMSIEFKLDFQFVFKQGWAELRSFESALLRFKVFRRASYF